MEKYTAPEYFQSQNSQDYIEHTLAKIDSLCKTRKIRLTPQRRTVIELMVRADKAMSAYDLLDQLKQIEPQAKPPTIYRALDFWIEYGFVHKVESINSYILCPHFDEYQHVSILFICNNCHAINEAQSMLIEQTLIDLSKQETFIPKHSILEIHGYCHHCQRI